MRFTLKDMAEAGYIMGLATIGEVATHMELHYDAHFGIEDFGKEWAEFELLIDGHSDDSIDLYLSADDKRHMDEELEKAMKAGADPEEFAKYVDDLTKDKPMT